MHAKAAVIDQMTALTATVNTAQQQPSLRDPGTRAEAASKIAVR